MVRQNPSSWSRRARNANHRVNSATMNQTTTAATKVAIPSRRWFVKDHSFGPRGAIRASATQPPITLNARQRTDAAFQSLTAKDGKSHVDRCTAPVSIWIYKGHWIPAAKTKTTVWKPQ